MNGYRQQAGYGLVEIMIALVLGLMVTGAVIQVFLATGQAGRTQEAMSRIQETGRFALEVMKPRLRVAGRLNACVAEMPVTNHLDPDGTGYDDALFDPARSVIGWEADQTGPGDALTVVQTFSAAGSANAAQWEDPAGDSLPASIANLAVAGSDILVVKSAEAVRGLTGCSAGNLVNSRSLNVNWSVGGEGCGAGTPQAPLSEAEMAERLPQYGLVLVTDCSSGGDFFQRTNAANATQLTRGNMSGSNPGPGNVTGNWSTQYDDTMQVFTLGVRAYFVGVNAAGDPALFELDYGSGGAGATPVELVSGVESLQILYGENDGGSALNWRPADEVFRPGRIEAIQLELLVRADAPADTAPDTGPFDLLGAAATVPADRRLRKTFRMTVAVRNRVEVI